MLSKTAALIEEQTGFTVKPIDTGYLNFSICSPAGQDFFVEVEEGDNLQELFFNLFNYYESFDVSYETYLWLDETGHGKYGAPYDMKDVYEDMEWCENKIHELMLFVDKLSKEEN